MLILLLRKLFQLFYWMIEAIWPRRKFSSEKLVVLNTNIEENIDNELELIASDCMNEAQFMDNAAAFGISSDKLVASYDLPLQDSPFDDEYYNSSEREQLELPKPLPQIPNHCIRWQKGYLLGTGSFGSVYLGLNLDTGELLAVKQVVLDTNSPSSMKAVEALQQEIAILSTLENPNIVRYYGSNVEGSCFNIFLEYVAGGSLSSIIKKFGNLNDKLVLVQKYTKQILLGLQYLHSRQIAHRDIKGANVLVDEKGVIKLSDFGASKSLEGIIGSACNSLKGTVYYMAPEVIKQSGYGRQADIWSLGCTVLEMLTGRPPWSTEFCNEISALYNIAMATEPPPFPPNLEEEIEDFLMLCFKRNPAERPNATKLLHHKWITSTNSAMNTPGGTPTINIVYDREPITLHLPTEKFKRSRTKSNATSG